MSKLKVAIVHPFLKTSGGSEARALWIAEALEEAYDVTLLTMGTPNLEALNAYYGTHLTLDQIHILSFPIPRIFKYRFDALRSYKLNKYCKQKSQDFDLMISTYNVMDFGRRGIQFIADFSFYDRLRHLLHPKTGFLKFFYKRSPLRWAYLILSKILSGTCERGWKRNLTVANSRWCGKIISESLGIKTQVLYPPVVGNVPCIDWLDKRNGFIAMGRLVPEKGFNTVIEILKSVRQKGHNIHLHILGPVDDRKYSRQLSALVRENEGWVFLEGQKSGSEKMEFIARHKYGISGCGNEAFGIAVAEMVKAGNIVFVPNGGGQTEIVDHPELIYDDVKKAVQKIDHVLGDNMLQADLLKHLNLQRNKFSVEIFQSKVKELVHNFVSN